MDLIKEFVDYFIIGILALMGFVSLWFSIERLMFLKKVNTKNYKTKDDLETALTNNLTAIYIVYSNAPYIGLLGTVIGIMITFYDMGQNGNIDTKEIMTGLSLALYATALGLIVAIPSLMSYHSLNRKIAVIASNFNNTRETCNE